MMLWLATAWFAPVAFAGAAGWKSVWGSGPAYLDYLLPLPITGGFLHVLTLSVVTAMLTTQHSWPPPAAGVARGLLLALALCGAVMLLDPGRLYLAATTDTAISGIRIRENPLALFLLSDSLLAQFFLPFFGERGPASRLQWASCAFLVIAAPALVLLSAIGADARTSQAFLLGAILPGPARSDEVVHAFTRLPMDKESFRAAAAAWAAQRHPNADVNVEDLAIRFHRSLEAAQSGRDAEAALTLCLYEDGTPPAWLPGNGDCFGSHESFSNRLERMSAAQDRQLPVDVRHYLGRVEACKDAKLPTGGAPDNLVTRVCSNLDALRTELLKKHGADPAVAARLEAASR